MTYIPYQPADEAHKKRERAKARELRKSSWWKQKLAQGVCYYCEQKFSAEELTMDHKVPVARGGLSTRSKVVISCKSCNTEKKSLTPAELIMENLKSKDDSEE